MNDGKKKGSRHAELDSASLGFCQIPSQARNDGKQTHTIARIIYDNNVIVKKENVSRTDMIFNFRHLF